MKTPAQGDRCGRIKHSGERGANDAEVQRRPTKSLPGHYKFRSDCTAGMMATGRLVTAERNRRGDRDDARMGALALGRSWRALVARWARWRGQREPAWCCAQRKSSGVKKDKKGTRRQRARTLTRWSGMRLWVFGCGEPGGGCPVPGQGAQGCGYAARRWPRATMAISCARKSTPWGQRARRRPDSCNGRAGRLRRRRKRVAGILQTPQEDRCERPLAPRVVN